MAATINEWPLRRLKNITSKIGSGATPRGGKNAYRSEGISLIRSLNVYDFKFSDKDLAFIGDGQAAKLDNVIVQEDDILLNITGASVARCCLVNSNYLPARVNQHVAIVRVRPDVADARFVFYCINSPHFKSRLLALAQGGATREALTKTTIEEFEVLQPPLPIQCRIGGILSAYDELIENCQRCIRILEAMVRAVYREWFVHFRFPNHENHPRVPSPLGAIPQGWEVKKLGDIADISWGDTSTTKASYVEEGFSAYSASGLDGQLDHYDFDWTGIVLSAIGAQCGKTWLAQGKWSCIKNTIRFWSKDECASNEFLFIATEGQDFWPRRGAAQPFISQGDAKLIDILTPDRTTMARFTTFSMATLERIATLQSQIQILRRTRDLLLPRLLSGQLELEAA
jgi:type I restriction enzyme, S subunit